MRFASWCFAAVAFLTITAVASRAFQRRPASGPTPAPSLTVLAAADGNAVVRLHDKDAVVADLIGGQLTLREAAGRFRDIDRMFPQVGSHRTPGDEDQPEGERYCRQVLRWVQTAAADESAGPAREVARRLAGELDVALRSGSIELSDVR